MGTVATRMRVPLTSVEKRVLQTYTPEEAKRIITHKPQSRTGKRMMALLYLLIDTGCRVSEALSLTRKAIDFDNQLITLQGKGNKQRRVPISLECRKRLYHWLASHEHDLVFCTNGGGKLHYDNVWRSPKAHSIRSVGTAASNTFAAAGTRYICKGCSAIRRYR